MLALIVNQNNRLGTTIWTYSIILRSVATSRGCPGLPQQPATSPQLAVISRPASELLETGLDICRRPNCVHLAVDYGLST